MPTVKSDIYIDASFFQTDSDHKDLVNSVEFVVPDNIGNYAVPVIYQAEVSVAGKSFTDVEYGVVDTTSGCSCIPISFFWTSTTNEAIASSLVNYSTSNTLSGMVDNNVIYSTGYNVVFGTFNNKINFIAGQKYDSFNASLIEYTVDNCISDTNDWWADYINYCGYSDIEGYPIPSLSGYKDPIVEYGVANHILGETVTEVEIRFAGWVDFLFPTDIYSTDAGSTAPYPFDVTTISGNIIPVTTSIYSSAMTLSGTLMDMYCSLLDIVQIDIDVELIPGRSNYIIGDIYSTVEDSQKLTCDFGLYSLKIANFSLDIDEYSGVSEGISVDVLDDVYGVSVSGTYFEVEGQALPVTFSGIEDGYRMSYSSPDDFSSLTGVTVFTAHAENLNNNILEEDFYLTFGYLVTHNNYPRFGLNYGYNKKVVVRVAAENMASCPKESADSNYFITERRKSGDLGVSITGMFHASAESNLSMEIYPQSLAYFYGKEFEVIIKAHDFSGNEIEPYILMYKIEEKPD